MPSTTERSVELLIKDLCDTILIKNDYIDTDAISRYINSLTDEEKSELNNFSSPFCETEARAITQEKTFEHIDSYHGVQNGQTPFDFDIDNNYQNYVDFFVSEYKKGNNYSEPPKIFFCVFRCIKEASENYKLYEKFYQLQESSMEESINALVESKAEKAATTAAKFASGLAVKLANEAADDARQSLKKIKEEENNIAQNVIKKASTEVNKSVNDLIKDKSVEMNLNISSTSVTILGIFAGIVLTIVAGLFYSSLVLESVSSANFYRLLSIASLVGLVCLHLVIVMFRYIVGRI